MKPKILCLMVIFLLILFLSECSGSRRKPDVGAGSYLSPEQEERLRIRTMARGIAKKIRSRAKTPTQLKEGHEGQTRSIQKEISSQYMNLAKIDELQHRIHQMNKYHARLKDKLMYRQRRRRMERLRRFSKKLKL